MTSVGLDLQWALLGKRYRHLPTVLCLSSSTILQHYYQVSTEYCSLMPTQDRASLAHLLVYFELSLPLLFFDI